MTHIDAIRRRFRFRPAIALFVVSLALAATALGCTQIGGNGSTTNGAAAVNTERATVMLDSSGTGIWVSGAGRVSVTPDIATLRVGVETTSETVSAAMSDGRSVHAGHR